MIKLNLNKIFYIFIILLLFVSIMSCTSQQTVDRIPNDSADMLKRSFEKGETITYKLSALIGQIGNQTFEVLDIMDYNGVKCYYVKSTTTLLPEIEEQFNYNYEDIIYAYIEYNSMLPIKVIKDINQGSYNDDVEIIFDQKNKKGVYTSQKKSPEGKELNWENTEGGFFELLSIVYHIRAKDMKVGDEFSISILDEKSFSPITNKVIVKEGEPFKGVPTLQLSQAEENANVNSITMRLMDNKGKNWIPINISIGLMKLGDLTIKLEGSISSYKENSSN